MPSCIWGGLRGTTIKMFCFEIIHVFFVENWKALPISPFTGGWIGQNIPAYRIFTTIYDICYEAIPFQADTTTFRLSASPSVL
jgi:hypothetical protein